MTMTLFFMTIFSQLSYAVNASCEEIDTARQWTAMKFGTEIPEMPFSFIYGGQSSSKFIKTWNLERTEKKLDEYRTQQTLTYTDPKTGLEVWCVIVL